LHVYHEMIQFDYLNWLPILEVNVNKGYFPENLLDICMNYFIWKGDLKASAEFARLLNHWNNKGVNEEIDERKNHLLLSELSIEFSRLEEEDFMKQVFHNNIKQDIFRSNTSVFYSALKTLYYSGMLSNIMLLRVFYASNVLYYSQIWEFGIRKLKSFTPYNPGILQEWLNVYFAAVDDDPDNNDLLKNILPVNPTDVERKRDLFMIVAFNRKTGKILRINLFKHRGDNKKPIVIWSLDMMVN